MLAMELEDVRLEALRQLLAEVGGKPVDLARRIKKSPAQVSQWFSSYRTITEKTAREIEARFPKPHRWMDEHPRGSGMAQSVIHTIRDTPLTLDWGALRIMDALPASFEADLPDDAMAPKAPAGTRVRFRAADVPLPGEGMIVRDKRGGVHFRECRLRADGGWNAFAYNPAFPTFHNVDDGLQVLAVTSGVTIGWTTLMR